MEFRGVRHKPGATVTMHMGSIHSTKGNASKRGEMKCFRVYKWASQC
jgi:hypothetical protein